MEANKLTTKSQEALSAAVRHSVDRGNPAVEPAHLLGALLEQTDGTAGPLLRAVGADLTDVRAENDALQGRLPSASGATVSAPQFSRDLHKVLTAAVKQAEELSDEYLSTEHLLVGLAAEGGPVADLLRRHGATPDALLEAFQQVRGGEPGHLAGPGGHLPGAGEVRRRPHRGGPRGQARPGHRPRHRDPPGRPGAVPPDQEQPGADRRARASARPPSSRAWPSGSWPATCRSRCGTSG